MLIYDGDCGFSTTSARFAERFLPLGVPVVAWQTFDDLEVLGLTHDDVTSTAWWIGVDGVPRGGHLAVGRAIMAMQPWWSALGWFLCVPPVSWIAQPAYALVATNRHRLPGATGSCATGGPLESTPVPSSASGASRTE